MAEIDKTLETAIDESQEEAVDIELEGEEPVTKEQAIDATEEFYKNIALDLSTLVPFFLA